MGREPFMILEAIKYTVIEREAAVTILLMQPPDDTVYHTGTDKLL